MNRYRISDEDREKYKVVIAEHLNAINNCNLHEETRYEIALDMTDMIGINPYTLGNILETDFGYNDRDIDRNGWQMDFWIHYRHPENKYPPVCIQGTGITGEFFLRGEEEDYESPEERDEKLKDDEEFQALMNKSIELLVLAECNNLLGEE